MSERGGTLSSVANFVHRIEVRPGVWIIATKDGVTVEVDGWGIHAGMKLSDAAQTFTTLGEVCALLLEEHKQDLRDTPVDWRWPSG